MHGHVTDEVELVEIGEDPDRLQRGPSAEDARAGVGGLPGSGALWRAEDVECECTGDNRNPTWLRVDFALE